MAKTLVSISQLSDLTNRDRKTVSKAITHLVAENGPKNSKLYIADDALSAIYLGDSSNAIQRQLLEEELRIERAKREKLEIELGRLRGELIPASEVVREVAREYRIIRALIRSIPSKLAKPLSLLTEPQDIYQRLSDAIDEVLSELSNDKKYEEAVNRLELSGEIEPCSDEPSENSQ